MLLELLPHFTRLVPVADKYFNNRTASDKAQEAALASLSGDVRGGLSKIAEESAGLRQKMQEQSSQTAELAVEVTRARMGTESVEARVARLEKTAALTVRLLWVALVLLAMVFAALVVRMR